jgi:hypothetical protein
MNRDEEKIEVFGEKVGSDISEEEEQRKFKERNKVIIRLHPCVDACVSC